MMDVQMIRTAIAAFLAEIQRRLDEAAGIARAAQACAATGNVDKGVEIALDLEQLVYEVHTLLNAIIPRREFRGQRIVF